MTDGTLNDIRETTPSYTGISWAFVVVILMALLVPLVGMLWAPSDTSAENREAAAAPRLLSEEGTLNVNVLSDAGSFFADHYAYRSYLVDADARLFSSVFGISTADNVIYGNNDWLYYAGTLGDYQDRKPLRERQAANIAHNMRLLQDWCEAQGSKFLFTIAPDKNELYGDDMPFYYPEVDGESMQLLNEWLTSEDVNYLNMFDVMREADDVQYFLRDSHWSDKGALLGHDALASALELQSMDIDESSLVAKDDYIGDLNRMLFPISAVPETDWYAAGVNDGSGASGTLRSGSYWDYVEGADPNDGIVVTAPSADSPYAELASENGRMLMFRDSFAIGLLPFFACETETARFDKMVPYDGLQLLDGNYATVIVERAQRHAADLAESAFIMPCPVVAIEGDGDDASGDARETDVSERGSDGSPCPIEATCNIDSQDSLVLISGDVAFGALSPEDAIYVTVFDSDGSSRTYEAFQCTGEEELDNAYETYVSRSVWAGKEARIQISIGSPLNIRAQSAIMELGTFE